MYMRAATRDLIPPTLHREESTIEAPSEPKATFFQRFLNI